MVRGLGEIHPVDITPDRFEALVNDWIQRSAKGLKKFDARQKHIVEGDSGEFEIDVYAEFEVFGISLIRMLIECKKWSSPVKRDVVLVLSDKLRDTGCHKGIIFSTSGFQSGAIEFASKRGIALVEVQHGETRSVVKSSGRETMPLPPWVHADEYIGWFRRCDERGVPSWSKIDDKRIDPLRDWMDTSPADQEEPTHEP